MVFSARVTVPHFADVRTVTNDYVPMNDSNRDLLVLSKAAELSPDAMKRELALLNSMLYHAESWESFCIANEILNIARHKIISKPSRMQRLLSDKKHTPFIFICNKN